MARPRLLITLGDPNGIGPEVTAKALARADVRAAADLAVVGLRAVLAPWLERFGGGEVEVIEPMPGDGFTVRHGAVDAAAGRLAHGWVEFAARACLAGRADGMVTAPVNKAAFAAAGIRDTGHQEVLQRVSGAEQVLTMLQTGGLRCVHLSTHKPLREACAHVTRANVLQALRLTDREFRRWGFAAPRVAVAALNPHAGEGGLIGREELDEIGPAVGDARAEGIDARGPFPADSVFTRAIAGEFDAVLVMYHDQGHIAVKVHGFERSVSVNLGLPFTRASVDHGTAFDIAGRGIASGESMAEAVLLAARLAAGRGMAAEGPA
ncbi:4-hydroxythreonine-4-phosphate dehydrogenase PdxA [Tepidiforma flava]|uniref:4-hydroxythreonine-4-phosphate dehydrogenase PdxA n=1 Tax=Tepidiforma flava TaxID=3004094 RepID=A0ABY7M8T5_9CHLR|nr:4-hydroxythreonine-4-phosphate dehydrogenase PdxA [Tepidiforma flava]WBL36936.1 4-hydroxythreonine-4-phosphate dehydrogenase PdxA [Tepidiforma flava]